MLSIDADAHVIECEKTWDYLEGGDKRYRPVAIAVDMPTGKTQNFWIIGGRLIGGRDNVGQDTSKESREMANIDSRLKHMDEIGTGVQVLYPTLFLRPVTDNPRIELALCRSYNRWMADIWSKEKKRLRWAVQLPLLSMDEALDELRWSQRQRRLRSVHARRRNPSHSARSVFLPALRRSEPAQHAHRHSFRHRQLHD